MASTRLRHLPHLTLVEGGLDGLLQGIRSPKLFPAVYAIKALLVVVIWLDMVSLGLCCFGKKK
jgi:hypothetical protein